MDKIKAEALIEKYKSGTLNSNENHLIEQWYVKLATDKKLNLEDGELEKNLAEIWVNINTTTKSNHKGSFELWKRIAVAGIILLVGGSSLYFFQSKSKVQKIEQQQFTKIIKPGGNRATLTLANGTNITLDDALNGKLAEQNGIIITKTKDGQLIYALSNEQGAEPKFNTITTPKGGQYQVHLPDGSKVWLNAQSSLKYPTFFTGKERKVTLTGEAYFEIAKVNQSKTSINNNMPFIVSTANQNVTVLGTHFNINSYSDEDACTTTLLEGSVKVTSFKRDNLNSVMLIPGQQSSLNGSGMVVSNVNADNAIAWKNGMFLFKDADLKTVMRSISRWYDVEVEYEGKLPNQVFSGDIHRNLNLNQLFEILNFFKVDFRIEGKVIVVSSQKK